MKIKCVMNLNDFMFRAETASDSVDCWQDRLFQLLQSDSRLFGPAQICIDQYAVNVTGN